MRLGQDRLNLITQDSDVGRTLDAIYDQILEELTAAGPQKGWKFARRRERIGVDSHTITIFADYSGTVADTVLCTAVSHGLVSGEMANIADTTNYDGDYEITRVGADTFYFEHDWDGDDATGTARWTSESYNYRYATPASLRLVEVQVAGIELTDWLEEGEYILTNLEDEEIDVIYVQSITDTTLFPPHFTKALWFNMAIEAAYGVIQSATAPERLQMLYDEKILPKAIAMDEKHKYVQESSSSWVDAGHTRFTLE